MLIATLIIVCAAAFLIINFVVKKDGITAVVKVDFYAVASGQLYDPLGLADAAAQHRLGLVDVCRAQIHHLLK